MKINLDYCLDILCEKKYEKYVCSILKLPIGTWFPIHVVLKLDEYSYDDSIIFVSWTKSINNEEDFSLIMFCEEESMKMATATYNSRRLLGA